MLPTAESKNGKHASRHACKTSQMFIGFRLFRSAALVGVSLASRAFLLSVCALEMHERVYLPASGGFTLHLAACSYDTEDSEVRYEMSRH